MKKESRDDSSDIVCPICAGEMVPCFNATVLGKYQAEFEVCIQCEFLRINKPGWLSEAYSRAIAEADTGLVMRNISLSWKLSGVLYWIIGDRGKGCFLDIAGGYGMLARLMRDLGFNFYWSDKYCDNLLAPGFEYRQTIGKCKAVTAFEVLEHLEDPAAFIKEALEYAGTETFIFSTELYKGKPPMPNQWWYYALETGQHIGFFKRRTLEVLGTKLGLYFASANGLHILSKTKVNEKFLRFVTAQFATRLTPWWVRMRLGTKTMSDHKLIMSRKT